MSFINCVLWQKSAVPPNPIKVKLKNSAVIEKLQVGATHGSLVKEGEKAAKLTNDGLLQRVFRSLFFKALLPPAVLFSLVPEPLTCREVKGERLVPYAAICTD